MFKLHEVPEIFFSSLVPSPYFNTIFFNSLSSLTFIVNITFKPSVEISNLFIVGLLSTAGGLYFVVTDFANVAVTVDTVVISVLEVILDIISLTSGTSHAIDIVEVNVAILPIIFSIVSLLC